MSRRSASSMFDPSSSSYSYLPVPSPRTHSSTMPTRPSAATVSRKPQQPTLKRPRPSSSGYGCLSSSDNGQTSVAKRQRRVFGDGESPVTVLDGGSASSMFDPSSSSYSYPPVPSPRTHSSTMPTRPSAATLSRKPQQPALKRPRPSSSGYGCSSFSDNGQTSVAKRQRQVFGGGELPVTVLDRSSSSPVPHSTEEIQKAARVAMTKARFAGTIVKARQHLLYSSTNTDLEKKIQTYRESVAQKADQLGVQVRSRERDAAYRKLLEVEKNVVLDDNFKTMKEFHMLMSGHKF